MLLSGRKHAPSRDFHFEEPFFGVEIFIPIEKNKIMFMLPLEILTPESYSLESKSPNSAKRNKTMSVFPPEIHTPENHYLESKSPVVERKKMMFMSPPDVLLRKNLSLESKSLDTIELSKATFVFLLEILTP